MRLNHSLRRFTIACNFLSLLVLAGCGPSTPPPAPSPQIAYAYHGMLLDRDLNVIANVTPAQADAFYAANGWMLARAPVPPLPPPPKPPARKMSPYMTECEKNGVPLPPPWGSPDWTNAGNLPAGQIFALPQFSNVEVWTFQTPLGICIALPRKDKNGDIQALGIICQGTESGKACFWDNIDGAGNKITGANTKGMDPADIQDGSVLKENCTACHRGDNVFIVHPGTPLEIPPKKPGDPAPTDTTKPTYTPVSGQPNWGNEPLGFPLAGGECDTCHSIPKLTKDYCAILKQAVGKTMPPPPDTVKDHANDVKKLKDECNKLDPTLNWK